LFSERAQQRATFREILRSVEDGEQPSEVLTINKSKYEFFGWSQIKQLNTFRSILGAGLNLHLSKNELLTEIFDLFVEQENLDGDDRINKEALIAASKAKAKETYQHHTKQRKNKAKARQQDDD
jgi:hypothetical protein